MRYQEKLAGLPSIYLPDIKVDPRWHAWHLFPIVVKPKALLSRDELIEEMARRGIGTSVHYKPIHRMSYYCDRYQLAPKQFPNAERYWRGCVSLPIYPTLRDEEVDYVCESIGDALSG